MADFFYTRAQYLDYLYREFVNFGENATNSQTFFTAYPTKLNNAPEELVLGINVKFPLPTPGVGANGSRGES